MALGCALTVNAQFNVGSPTVAFTVQTNFITAVTTNLILLTNPCKIANIQLIAGANATNGFQVDLFDNNATNVTITNAAFTNRVEFTTNQVTTTISPLTGVTNIFTNLQFFETNIVFGTATNNLPFRSFFAVTGTGSSYNVSIINDKGIMVRASTNGIVAVTYRLNQ